MKIILTFLFLCAGWPNNQDPDFREYMSHYKMVTLPIKIDSENTALYFNGNIWDAPDAISKNYIKKYITNDSNYLTEKFGYGYGITWSLDEYNVVLLSRLKDQGDNAYNFDLLEKILFVYDKNGKYIDSKLISKDNEVWWSSINIVDAAHIKVTQSKLLIKNGELIDVKQVQMAQVDDVQFTINSSGKIDKQITQSRSTSLVWDDRAQQFTSPEP